MALERGVVASINENGWAQVVTDRRDACGSCGGSHCCQATGPSSKMVTRALNRAGAGVGDLVSLSLKSVTVIKGAAVLYMIPMAGLMFGAISGAGLSPGMGVSETAAAMILGFAGLALGFIVTTLVSKWMSVRRGLTPIITRVIRTEVDSTASLAATDPVCNMKVDPSKAAATSVYRGKKYFFCHPGCRESFIKDPLKYL